HDSALIYSSGFVLRPERPRRARGLEQSRTALQMGRDVMPEPNNCVTIECVLTGVVPVTCHLKSGMRTQMLRRLGRFGMLGPNHHPRECSDLHRLAASREGATSVSR